MRALTGVLLRPLARWLAAHPKVLFIGALVYILSPVDFLPEAILGPIGYLDDLIMLLLPFIIREYARQPEPTRRPPTPDVVDTHLE